MRHILLALRMLAGKHSGENQGVLLWSILCDLQITDYLGYFTLDSGAYNAVTLRWLAEKMEIERGWTFDVDERYIRCFGHVLNLIVEAFLIGSHYSNLKRVLLEIEHERQNIAGTPDLTAAQRRREFEAQEARELAEWRKTGPLGKLRNIIVSISRSHNRRELFITIVRKCKADGRIASDVKAELLVVPNDTRWNSTCDAIARAQKLRPAVQQYLDLHRGPAEDQLSSADWQNLALVHEILQPFRVYTLALEGNKDNGALYDIIRLFESLRKILTSAYCQHLVPRPQLAASLDFAIKKLNKYYNDAQLPSVVYAAVVLHPDLKMRYFEAVYRDNPTKLDSIKSKVQDIWAKHYERTFPTSAECETQQSQMYADIQTESQAEPSQTTEFGGTASQVDDLFNSWKLEYPGSASQLGGGDIGGSFGELDTYLSEPSQKTTNPVEWWIANEERYPILSKLALNIHSIPAMSAECERVFSNTKLVLTERRCRMGDNAIEANQVLRSWIRGGLIAFEQSAKVIGALREMDSDFRRRNPKPEADGEETASEDDDDEL